MDLNDLSYRIRGAIYKVHSALGPGLFENVYEAAMIYELGEAGLSVQSQVVLPVFYNDVVLELGFKVDLLIEETVIVEIKSVRELQDVDKKQLTNYLKLSKLELGLLVNFNVASLVDKVSLIRVINSKNLWVVTKGDHGLWIKKTAEIF